MSISKVFMQFEDNDTYESNVVDLIVQSLQVTAERMKTEEINELGEGFESVTRPWALVFLKDDTPFQAELSTRKKDQRVQTEERLWLNSIRVCRIDSSHQLRVILCDLHIKNKEIRSHEPQQLSVLKWIENEKDEQPPSLIVAVDLLELLAEGKKDYNKMQFMTINNNELATVLAILVESCIFESTIQTDHWEQNLGIKMNQVTDLIVTDKSLLPCLKEDENRDKFENTAIENLHKILQYYLDHVYTNTA